ncbi:MAG: hypothetical protein CSA42_02155 [Gammaproteobacteria bacterium]|nr:MAG: hypothetical protein CSA42_02155 [Gammaproteobacteria bacterium]
MTAKLLWEIGASLQIVVAVAHFLGTLFSQLLHPTDKNLIEQMQTTLLNVDKKATQWNAWIFFNIAFALLLFIVGAFSFTIAYQNFAMIKGVTILSLTQIVTSLIMIYFAHKFSIRKVRTAFLITTLFYLISTAMG